MNASDRHHDPRQAMTGCKRPADRPVPSGQGPTLIDQPMISDVSMLRTRHLCLSTIRRGHAADTACVPFDVLRSNRRKKHVPARLGRLRSWPSLPLGEPETKPGRRQVVCGDLDSP